MILENHLFRPSRFIVRYADASKSGMNRCIFYVLVLHLNLFYWRKLLFLSSTSNYITVVSNIVMVMDISIIRPASPFV